ncbi:filamentous hemagglutinin N-terminal domain-containing protein [Altericista sp. CCNU0014]|uniref:filamentous hemagglutinin N-terminal domain-containing protein n=1 Tax=Altericista sp. CCNU0014 TaxID=3082949 RepID=UPI00384A7717
MTQNHNFKSWKLKLLFSAAMVVVSFVPNHFAWAQIKEDNTLGKDSSRVIPDPTSSNVLRVVDGATQGSNLFHSFAEFNVNNNQTVYFNVLSNIDRIIARVTGGNKSNILGKLGVSGGDADLFLLNPSGIIFGPNSSLDLKGSFLATTASSFVFENNTEYSAIDTLVPQLSINIPLGLRFRNTGGVIENNSNATVGKIGLQVLPGKSLALLGENILLNGGFLTANSGHIDVGSVTEGQVDLIDENLTFNYQKILPQNFGDISILRASTINVSGTRTGRVVGGSLYVQGKNVKISDGSRLFSLSFSGKDSGGSIKIKASDSFEITGNIIRSSLLSTSSSGQGGVGGDIIIDAEQFFMGDYANIQTSSVLFQNSVNLSAAKAGSIFIESTQANISGKDTFISASTNGGSGDAGNITVVAKGFLKVGGSAEVRAISNGQGTAGNIDIFARSVLLENQGIISATTTGGEGRITFHDANDITLRNNSKISANATNSANGGNIIINTALLLAVPPVGSNGSDITAKAIGGTGGNITINAQGIFGIRPRKATLGNQTNDIDASSQFGQSGQVQINTTTDPNQGLIELPATVVDPSTLVAQNPCKRASSSEFTRSGRGGLPPSLSQDLNGQSTQVGLVEPANLSAEKPESKSDSKQASSQPPSSSQIQPARGWVYNDKGEVVLVAYNSAVTGPQRLQSAPAGCPVL